MGSWRCAALLPVQAMASLGPSTRAVVIDNGSGYSKVGYAGNVRPDYVFPTAIAAADEGASEIGGSARDGLRDLDFCVGDLAVGSSRHTVNYPVRHGLIENWTNMERVWQRCFFEHLRADPEDAYVVLVRGRGRRGGPRRRPSRLAPPLTASLSSTPHPLRTPQPPPRPSPPLFWRADGAAAQPPREPRVHCRGHV